MSDLAPILRAGLWMIGTMLSFAAMAVGGRELAGDISTFQILFWRSFVGLVIIAMLLTRFGWGQVRSTSMRIHAMRNLVHFAAQFCWFYAIAHISLAEVVALEFTTPIWTAILASLFLNESLRGWRMAAIGFGFLGVLIIVRPGFAEVQVGTLAGLGAGFGYAVALTSVRFLAQRDSVLCILFYMMAMQLPLGLLPALEDWVWPSAADWPWVVLVGVTGLSAHYCITRAMKLAEAAAVTTMGFMRLPLIALIGYLAYGEALEVWLVVGAALICTGLYLNIRDANMKQERTAGSET